MKNTLIGLCIFFVGLAFYILTLRGVYGNIKGSEIKNNLDQGAKPFELSPERGRFILTLSLAESNSLMNFIEAGMVFVAYKKEKESWAKQKFWPYLFIIWGNSTTCHK